MGILNDYKKCLARYYKLNDYEEDPDRAHDNQVERGKLFEKMGKLFVQLKPSEKGMALKAELDHYNRGFAR